jgi:hypothetical protein
VEQARSSVEWGRESLRGNLRRRTGAGPPPGKGYDDAILVLDYAAVHTAGVTRTVLEAATQDLAAPRPHPELAHRYAEFLRHTAHALRLYSHSRFGDEGDEHGDELRAAAARLRAALHDLRRDLVRSTRDDPDEVATYGALLAQAHRLADQLVVSGA